MKKHIIISIVIILLIVSVGSIACSRGHMEGFKGVSGGNTETLTLSSTISKPVTSVTVNTSLNNATLLGSLTKDDYVAFIDENTNSLKISKITDAGAQGKVIWDSKKSKPSWTGNKLTLSNTSLTIGDGDAKIAAGLSGANELTFLHGDLVIKNSSDQAIWSLLSDEIQSTNLAVKEYITRGSRIYQSIELDYLKNKLANYDNYIKNLSSSTYTDKTNHKKIVEVRRQMDFEISQLNGKGGSKLAVSTTTLQSAMYLNLGITVLAASLFVLIATR